eukprot:CAMPEP_0194538314 /NCGR_PEP_ID=MMETSP0253-20130528/77806_1 /TAXON_ID=2966 /ORGANISM="Noctiluca scintillans" /LENGTH=239 /DNA_ID=CAMNT_0039384415 /DNA_START=42 /DNA_END=761 /DNA_ORIENTATION=-
MQWVAPGLTAYSMQYAYTGQPDMWDRSWEWQWAQQVEVEYGADIRKVRGPCRVRFADEEGLQLVEVQRFTPVLGEQMSRRDRELGRGCDTVLAMMDSADAKKRRFAMLELRQLVVQCSLSERGREVVQRALQVARRGDEQDSIVQELHGNVPALAVSPHGSEVLQSCLELLPPQKSGFIAQELCGHAAAVAQHAHGREVLRQVLDLLLTSQTEQLLKEVLQDVPQLCEDPADRKASSSF